MTAIDEINKLKDEVNSLKNKNKLFVKGANKAITELREELMQQYRLNYQLSMFKKSVFEDIQPDIVKFNENCFKCKELDNYKKIFNDFKNEVYYFTILKGKADYIVLHLSNEIIEHYTEEDKELIFKTPASFIEYEALKNKLSKQEDVELNYYKCKIKNIDKVLKALKNE